ncbi:hypothetical protein QE407_003746 [Pantoea dispersa]|nr:hypothetical protein [Pantoea dispersa]
MFLPVFGWIKQLGAAALFKLQIEQNDVCRIEVIACQLKKNIVSLFQRFIFSKAII